MKLKFYYRTEPNYVKYKSFEVNKIQLSLVRIYGDRGVIYHYEYEIFTTYYNKLAKLCSTIANYAGIKGWRFKKLLTKKDILSAVKYFSHQCMEYGEIPALTEIDYDITKRYCKGVLRDIINVQEILL